MWVPLQKELARLKLLTIEVKVGRGFTCLNSLADLQVLRPQEPRLRLPQSQRRPADFVAWFCMGLPEALTSALESKSNV